MSQALYRKYRPKDFDQVLGQDNIVNILKNQIKNKNISHAYIFSGGRGTGKTSTAKIFSKAVNCLNPIEGNPCNECANCRSILEERTMDIVEMDAASNRRIDDIRQLRDQVIYPPSNLKYKVYIIDEAHMITNEGFNALLKIMEEPPKHLIFILATTEIDKIPDTILSRTQRFEFKSISERDISKQINLVLDQEDVKLEDRAVDIIANAASGAMRDGLSILDQVISIGKKEILASDVYDLLGIFSDQVKINYAQAIFNKNIESLLRIIDDELDKGKNPNNFIKEIISFFKDLIYVKLNIKSYDFNGLVENISLEQIINSLDILLEYEDMMKKSDNPDLLFKLASVRLVDYMPRLSLEEKVKNLEERIAYLEENGSIGSNKRDIENRDTLRSPKHEKSEAIQINEEGSFLDASEDEEEIPIEKQKEQALDHSNEQTDSSVEDSSDIGERYLFILSGNYPQTKPLLKGIKKINLRENQIDLQVDQKEYRMISAMKIFFESAGRDLSNEMGKEYKVNIVLSKGTPEETVEKDKKIDELSDFFDGNINIINKK
ncbi:DNA polymerase III subunit gamma/tau [uncultured Helcococcus sp.]|uniref:DNA polymerase III subunit gamma/tau n=1 Tax=uncultured Helcococcus sp. TaxID=1072508 RepID=UPI00288BA628|nr:DNA polymerase III subunit gamma/tau [uncultured Helcococcus sp.]